MIKTASLFSQLLEQFPLHEFTRLMKKHRAKYGTRGFSCWTQFVSVVFCQVAHTDSLREICNGLACCLGKLSHLELEKALNKSNLSHLNAHRPAALERFCTQTHSTHLGREHGLGLQKNYWLTQKIGHQDWAIDRA